MTILTENEKKLIPHLIVSTFNGDYIELDRDWGEQEPFENEDFFESIVDTRMFAKYTGLSVATIKGELGSLVKKGLITLIDDIDPDDKPMSWLRIDEQQFNEIKKGMTE